MTNTRELGFGIIGTGAIFPLHSTAIANCPGARLVAVADVSEERARKTGEEHGVAWYTDHRELLANPDVDIVCVCTPSGMRAPVCIDAARAGKHILAEKPLEVTLEKVDSIIEECDRSRVKLGVIFQIRFMSGVLALKRAVDEGRLGRLVMGDACVKWHRSQEYYDSSPWRGTWALDGGVLMNQAIHHVDLLQWIMGPVESVFAHTDRLVRERIEVEDTAVACVRFANGALGVIEACTSASHGVPGRLEIRGEHGTVILEDGKVALWKVDGDIGEGSEPADLGSGAHDPMAITADGHQVQINDMADAVNQDRPPLIDGREARKAIEIIWAIYRSSGAGEKVALPLSVDSCPQES